MDNELSLVVDALPGLVWTADTNGHVDFLNQYWCDYTGLTRDACQGPGWLQAIHPDDRAALTERWQIPAPFEADARIRRCDGAYRWFLFRARPISTVKWYGIATDVDDRRQAEDAIRVRERRLSLIVDRMPTLVTFMTPTGELAFVNREVRQYFGTTLEQLQSWPTGNSFHPDDRAGVVATWNNSVQTGAPFEFQGRRQRADGANRWFSVRGFPLHDDEGRIVLWYLLHTDIEDRKRAEDLLAGEKRLLEMVAAGVGLPIILDALCHLIDDLVETCSSSVLLPGLGAAADATRCWSYPIRSATHQPLATLAMSVRHKRPPDGNDLRVIETACNVARIAIERDRSQTSLTQALVDLKNSENQLRTILDSIPTMAWCTLADGSGKYWSQRWHDYTGLSADRARNGEWHTVVHPDDHDDLVDTWRRHLATGQAGEIEGRLKHVDGAYRWFLFRFEPLRDSVGRIVNWYGTNTDIDDRKRAETLLAGEKQLLEMVAGEHEMSDILAELCRLIERCADPCHCVIVLVNPGGTRLELGSAPSLPDRFVQSYIGRPVDTVSGPCAMAVYLNQEVISTDLAAEPQSPSYDWCQSALALGLRACWSVPIASSAGDMLGAFAIYYQEPRSPPSHHRSLVERLTHIASIAIRRTQNRAALKRSEEFLAKTRRLSQTAGFSKNIATGEIIWSEEHYRIFEIDPGVPITVDVVRSRIHPDDQPAFQDMLDKQPQGNDFEVEFRLLMPNQSIKYIHTVAHASRDREGQVEYIAAVQDVTQRRLAEEALATARSELARVARISSLGALTASIAHEVNQPLSGIITNASTCLRMLAADPPNIDGARETARRTIRDGNRASDVIARLRALFARKDATTEPVDLNAATSEVIALSLGQVQRSRVILRQDLAADLPPVTGDRIQLQQVILNLLLNAMDAMSCVEDRPRQLLIRTSQDDDGSVLLTVKDSGTGFDPRDAQRLFDPFYTTKTGGMGIGLSVSRSIIESHQGRLWARRNDCAGATFAFAIPRRVDAAENA